MNQSEKDLAGTSKFLSLVLRHQPETIGLTLDAQGWADVETLLARVRAQGGRHAQLDRATLEAIVATSDKKRFAFSEDGTRIRASQGHSVQVDLGLAPQAPPATLYHGTASRFAQAIGAQGLVPGARQHVHLSRDVPTALTVGARHGKPVVFTVDAARMHAQGHAFYVSANGVWLCAAVPAEYLALMTAA